jgi:hypothetical protein
MSEGQSQASAEIEVTPEMVRAGALALLHFDAGWNDDETAVRVYLAMEEVRRLEACSDDQRPHSRSESSHQAAQSSLSRS